MVRPPASSDIVVESSARLRHVAILYHPLRPQALQEAEWLANELRGRGVHAVAANGWDGDRIDHIGGEQDLVVAFGGDGTIIRVVRFAAPHAVPVLGINLGRVGFLAELTPSLLHDCVDALVERRFWIEQRAMLDVTWTRDGQIHNYLCVNEVAVARGIAPRAIHVATLLDGEEFLTYTADGVLVATATGSTAYSLAAGGPILYPESTDFMLTPVAPHLHIGSSTVLPGETTVTLRLLSDRPAVVSVDGQEETGLHPGDTVTVRRSELCGSFARMGQRSYFYTALADRLR